MRLEGLGQLESPMTSSGIELTTFWLVACLPSILLIHNLPPLDSLDSHGLRSLCVSDLQSVATSRECISGH
jgi:hypothetical protein